jgi:hypothetical protein
MSREIIYQYFIHSGEVAYVIKLRDINNPFSKLEISLNGQSGIFSSPGEDCENTWGIEVKEMRQELHTAPTFTSLEPADMTI